MSAIEFVRRVEHTKITVDPILLDVRAGSAPIGRRTLGLPSGEQEIPLIIQDRGFAPDGSLTYPVSELTARPAIRDRRSRSSLATRFW
jgi:hypothetical protein